MRMICEKRERPNKNGRVMYSLRCEDCGHELKGKDVGGLHGELHKRGINPAKVRPEEVIDKAQSIIEAGDYGSGLSAVLCHCDPHAPSMVNEWFGRADRIISERQVSDALSKMGNHQADDQDRVRVKRALHGAVRANNKAIYRKALDQIRKVSEENAPKITDKMRQSLANAIIAHNEKGVEVAASMLLEIHPDTASLERMTPYAPLPIREAIGLAKKALEARREENRKRKAEIQEAQDEHLDKKRQLYNDELIEINRKLEAYRKQSHIKAVRFLAGLPPIERDNLATDDERRKAIDMRKDSLPTSRACEAIGCTKTELNRWDEEGKLPHLYQKKISIPGAKATMARYWNLKDIDHARAKISEWREEWSNRKSMRRTKKKLVRWR
jgi:hypothetical protein